MPRPTEARGLAWAGDRDVRRLSRALRGPTGSAATAIVIDELPNIVAAIGAGVVVEAVFSPEARPLAHGDALSLGHPGPRLLTLATEDYARLFRGTRAPTVFALANLPPLIRPKDLAQRPGDLIVLDGVVGPGNTGSVVRLAAAFEAAAVVVVGVRRAELYRRGIIRASAGTIFRVPVTSMSATELIGFCERNGRAIIVTSAHQGDDINELAKDRRPLALAFGSETRGASDVVAAAARRFVHIPTSGRVESLNISSAAAIALFVRCSSRSLFQSVTSLPASGSSHS